VKLFVATLLLAALALGAKLAVERLAPERVASAADGDTGGAKAASDVVQSVRITGSGLRATSLDELIETRAGEPLDHKTLDADRLRIVRALAADGYLDAGVEEPRLRASDGGLAIELPVVTGSRYLVREVRVDGKLLRRHPDLGGVPTLRSGQDAVSERIDGNVELLRDWLADRGSKKAGVGVRLEIDRRTQVVDVVFTAN